MHTSSQLHTRLLCTSSQQCCPLLKWSPAAPCGHQVLMHTTLCPHNIHYHQARQHPAALPASANQEALQQVAASLRKATLTLHQRTGEQQPTHGATTATATATAFPTHQHVSSNSTVQGSTGHSTQPPSSGSTGALEGKALDLYLGPLQLIQQRFTVSSRASDAASSSAAPRTLSSTEAAATAATAAAGGIPQLEFNMITPRDVDEVMDMYIDHGLNDSDPYWTRVWPSAIALAAHILAHPSLVYGKRVADLGCGLGLAGLAAAAAGASEVVFLDREPLALQCALLSTLATGSQTTGAADALAAAFKIEGLHFATSNSHGNASSNSNNSSNNSSSCSSSSSKGSSSSSNSSCHASEGSDVGIGQLDPAEFCFNGGELPAFASLLQHASHAVQHAGTAAVQSSTPQDSTSQHSAPQSSTSQHDTSQHSTSQHSAPHTSTAHTSLENDNASARGKTTGVHGRNHSQQVTTVRGQVFDWHAGPQPLLAQGGRYDVLLACDVLYEEAAVEPIAALVPNILKTVGGHLLLADPPNRTVRNRARFLELLSEAAHNSNTSSSSAGRKLRAARLVMEECSVVDSCKAQLLDPEMTGGMGNAAQTHGSTHAEVVPVQLMVFRSTIGNDTVGLKAS